MKFNETFEEFMGLYSESVGSAMRDLDKISGQQEADKVYGAIHAEVQKGKSVEEVLKDMNYPEHSFKVMAISYKNWLASSSPAEDSSCASNEEEPSEDNEIAKKVGKTALKVAGRAVTGTTKLIGSAALGVADHITYGDASKTLKTIKRAYSGKPKEDAEDKTGEGIDDYTEEQISQFAAIDKDLADGKSLKDIIESHGPPIVKAYIEYMTEGEGVEDCETCGCEENPEYDHFNDKYSDYIDQYKKPAEDGERIDKDRMKCNSPKRGGSKKFVVKACENGKEKIVRFGDPNMKIRKSNPKARKSFRARHKCDQKKSKFSAGYWSCKKW